MFRNKVWILRGGVCFQVRNTKCKVAISCNCAKVTVRRYFNALSGKTSMWADKKGPEKLACAFGLSQDNNPSSQKCLYVCTHKCDIAWDRGTQHSCQQILWHILAMWQQPSLSRYHGNAYISHIFYTDPFRSALTVVTMNFSLFFHFSPSGSFKSGACIREKACGPSFAWEAVSVEVNIGRARFTGVFH